MDHGGGNTGDRWGGEGRALDHGMPGGSTHEEDRIVHRQKPHGETREPAAGQAYPTLEQRRCVYEEVVEGGGIGGFRIAVQCDKESPKGRLVVVGIWPRVVEDATARGIGEEDQEPVGWRLRWTVGGSGGGSFGIFSAEFEGDEDAMEFVMRNDQVRIEFDFGDTYKPIYAYGLEQAREGGNEMKIISDSTQTA